MGQITAFDLKEFIENFKTEIYFETGTGECVSLNYASKFDFKKLYSVDLDIELYNSAVDKFKLDNRVSLINNFSSKALEEFIPVIDKNTPILFFLDAHFPGADFHKTTYEQSIREYKEDAFPLEKEIRTILSLRDYKKDVFIIDDFVLYDKNNQYESIRRGQVWQYDWLQEELNIKTNSDFIFELFDGTHTLEKDYRHQGYLIIKPIK